ncbi:hypothetical protein O6H91_21G075200 [Diphasiastrum complanatum]|uniref:Uncharacterized protein n=1 Tax=Diphasiastrum complanatum TaxID=34168 RepID=A0ACC2ALX3_DIPCM|nr:hypothetical protein O6H91_21G075200 [Diphasiastrum complanatum]
MGFQACSFCTNNCYTARHGQYGQAPAPIVPTFYKLMTESIVTEEYYSQLRIPASFVKKHTKELSAIVILEGPSGQKWVAALKTATGGAARTEITRGWRAFSSNHKLEKGDVLIFKLVAKAHFLVQIFDKHGCEKEASYKADNNSKLIDHSGLLSSSCEYCKHLKVDNEQSDSLRTKKYDRLQKAYEKDCDCRRFTNRAGKWPLKKHFTKAAPSVTDFPDLAARNASDSVPVRERKSPHPKSAKELRVNKCNNLCSTPNPDTDKLRRTTEKRSEHRQPRAFKLSEDYFQPVQSVKVKSEQDQTKEIEKIPSEDYATARNNVALGRRILEQSLQYREKMEETQRTTSKKQAGKRKRDSTFESKFLSGDSFAHSRKAFKVLGFNVRELYRKISSHKNCCCMQSYPIITHGSPLSEASFDSANAFGFNVRELYRKISSHKNCCCMQSYPIITHGSPLSEASFDPANALNAALARKSTYPNVVKIMRKSEVQKGFWLGFPKDFALKWLPKMDTCGTLIDSAGKRWSAKWFAKRNGLSAGWRRFSVDHYLRIGDTCVFELINKHKLVVKIHIFRARVADVDPHRISFPPILPAKKFAKINDLMKCSSLESLGRGQSKNVVRHRNSQMKCRKNYEN